MNNLLLEPVEIAKNITNVASVAQLSPFRYPGGKTWLVPKIRQWLKSLARKPEFFIEPFAGGAIISLSIAAEYLAEKIIFCELDHRVASVWHTILEDAEWLCDRIAEFEMNIDNVKALLGKETSDRRLLAFQTIVRNRVQHGGIIAPGASFMKSGENGKGILSRWYPQTLIKRIQNIRRIKDRLTFLEGDGVSLIQRYIHNPDTVFFIDPPYTAGGKKAGKRLYLHNEVNHPALFELMSKVKGNFLMTYDNSPEVIEMAVRHGFIITKIPMKNTHNTKMVELLISKR